MIIAQIYENFKCNYLIKTKTKQNHLQQRFKISKYKCLPVSHFFPILLFSGRRCRIQMTSHSFTRWREQKIEKHKSNRFKVAVDGYRNSLSTLYLYWSLWKFDTRDRLTPGLVNHLPALHHLLQILLFWLLNFPLAMCLINRRNCQPFSGLTSPRQRSNVWASANFLMPRWSDLRLSEPRSFTGVLNGQTNLKVALF